MEVRVRLLKLAKTNRDLLEEVRKRGYPRLSETQLSGYIHKKVSGQQPEYVMTIVYKILDEWEAEKFGENQ